MKKIKSVLITSMFTVLIMGMTSCKKCYECYDKNGNYLNEECKAKDQPWDGFKTRIEYLEGLGFTCK